MTHLKSVLCAAAVGLVLTVTGCSDKTSDAQSQAKADTMEKAVLTVGMELAYPPFEGKDAAGNPAGVSPDFMKDFGKAVGKEIKIENRLFVHSCG